MRWTAVWVSAWLVAAACVAADEPPAKADVASRESASLDAEMAPTASVAKGASASLDAEMAPTASVAKGASASLDAEMAPTASVAKGASASLDSEMEGIEKSLVDLKKDLVVLEEDLLFPASSQVAVFLSMDVGEFFALDSVSVKLNGKEVTHYLYTDKQANALFRGGVQRLFVGNARQGSNELTAFFTGKGPAGRDYRRATTVSFDKTFEPTFVELKISDSTAKYQPEFVATVSP